MGPSYSLINYEPHIMTSKVVFKFGVMKGGGMRMIRFGLTEGGGGGMNDEI